MRILLILVAAAALLPGGAAMAANPGFVDTLRRVCIDTTTSVDAQVAAGRQAGFNQIDVPTPAGFDRAVGMSRPEGDTSWMLIVGSMTTEARGGFPKQSGLTCLIGGTSGIDLAGVERWIGLKPYSVRNGVKSFAFERVGDRFVPLDGEDSVAVTAALGRKGYYLLMLGETNGEQLAIVAFSKSPGR